MKVCVSGANGFVGRCLCEHLQSKYHSVVPAVRVRRYGDEIEVGNIDAKTRWMEILAKCNVVVHLAARVHVMEEGASNPLVEFRNVNVAGTLNLARQAAQAGVKRFIFISSIKVNGEETVAGRPFMADDTPGPRDPYGVSKMEAEQGLRAIARETGLEVVIVRPPLVYGPGVRANFEALMRAVARGVPLPFSAIHNRRSLVALDNLVDLIACCVDHPRAAGQTFMVSDDEDLSTPDLIRHMAKAMDRPARLLNVPVEVLRMAAKLAGKSSSIQRLVENLQVDISKTKTLLDWTPVIDVDEGLRRTVAQWQK
jgi:nucleoside-diphosphate-sugar epimerase